MDVPAPPILSGWKRSVKRVRREELFLGRVERECFSELELEGLAMAERAVRRLL